METSPYHHGVDLTLVKLSSAGSNFNNYTQFLPFGPQQIFSLVESGMPTFFDILMQKQYFIYKGKGRNSNLTDLAFLPAGICLPLSE